MSSRKRTAKAPPPKEARTSFLFRSLEKRHRVAIAALQQAWNTGTMSATLVALLDRYAIEAEQAQQDRAKLMEVERILYDLKEAERSERVAAQAVAELRRRALAALPLVTKSKQMRID